MTMEEKINEYLNENVLDRREIKEMTPVYANAFKKLSNKIKELEDRIYLLESEVDPIYKR